MTDFQHFQYKCHPGPDLKHGVGHLNDLHLVKFVTDHFEHQHAVAYALSNKRLLPLKTLPHVTISSTISLTMENISIVDDDFDDGNDIVEAGHVNL